MVLINSIETEATVNFNTHKNHLGLRRIIGIKASHLVDIKVLLSVQKDEDNSNKKEKRDKHMKIVLNVACKKSARKPSTNC